MNLIVGLGNPGPEYAWTRHNAGFFVVDRLASHWGVTFRRERQADVARVPAHDAVLLKPRSYMNLSGGPVQAALTRDRARLADLLVVHDDLDLPFGKLRFKMGGGAGGQRGVKDIADRLGPDFVRLKVGISRPPAGWEAQRWVLARFSPEEREVLSRVVDAAAAAVETYLSSGLTTAMNQTNGLDLTSRDGNDVSADPTGSTEVS